MIFSFQRRVVIVAVRDAWPVWLIVAGIGFAGAVGWALSCNARRQQFATLGRSSRYWASLRWQQG
jgi:hypothetical protein